MNSPPDSATIRVIIQQYNLFRYRIPVYQELTKRPGIELKVLYANTGQTGMAEPDRFDATITPTRTLRLGRHTFFWHSAQWKSVSPKVADVVILSWDLHYLSLLPSLLKARLRGVPTILWGHGYSKNERGWRRTMRNAVARLATAVLFYEDVTAQRFIDEGWPKDRVHVALNSLDLKPIQAARESWTATPDRLDAFKRQHGLEEGPVILFVSRFREDNRTDMLIEAASRLREDFPSLRVVLIGDGPDRERLVSFARDGGVEKHVVFAGAIFDEQEIAPWFLSSDVFCYPVNIGLSILHAFGYGIPVVTSDRREAQNPEIIALESGVNGMVYEHGKIDSMVEVLRNLLAHPDRCAEMGREARRTVEERFNTESMVDGMEGAIRYAYAAASRGRPRGSTAE
ncbi:MAG: glycosyltransferase family 1 protein [Phycisphaerales bacterium]|nr:MAG: glycosyltransferase family 1 protein [Phycisphaerales bacterium]